ncbi:MAG TPA: MCE family protein [Jatrophihabitans sp.]|jgi:virulence factor Mce-like protein
MNAVATLIAVPRDFVVTAWDRARGRLVGSPVPAFLASRLFRLVTAGALVALVALLVSLRIFVGAPTRTVTAQFSSAVGIYKGTPVEILGVKVGSVTKVRPEGNHVNVTLHYASKHPVPASAIAVVVANSLVSDRYVQLAPAYTSGAQLADHATIPLNRTASPAELDDVYSALDKLSTALGPNGANKNGSLNALLQVAASNLKGNGAALGQSVQSLSQAANTLANGRDDLFGTLKNLQVFTDALSASDSQVRHFEEQLAQVSGELAAERGDLGSALHQLGTALDQVATFVDTNATDLHTDITGLKNVAGVLVKNKASLDETLAIAPVALANIIHAYQSDLGVIATRSNLGSLTDPGQICQLMDAAGLLGKTAGNLLGPLTGQIVSACNSVIKNLPSSDALQLPPGTSLSDLTSLLDQLLGGLSSATGGLVGGGS